MSSEVRLVSSRLVSNLQHTYGCTECAYRGPSQSSLVDHWKVHTQVVGERKARPSVLICPHCPRTYANAYNLYQHTTAKHRTKATRRSEEGAVSTTPDSPLTFPCPLCPRTYTNYPSARSHIRLKHPPPGTEPPIRPKRHVCTECDKAFPSPSQLAVHTRARHTGERPYACEQCDFRAVRRSDLVRHLGEHAKEEKARRSSVSCPQCPRLFDAKRARERGRLADHIKKHHEGKSPWKCHVCGALYGGNTELVQHRYQKHGEWLPKAKRRKVEKKETVEEAEIAEEPEELPVGEDEEEMDQIAVFQDHPEVKEEFEDDEEEIVFCKTIQYEAAVFAPFPYH